MCVRSLLPPAASLGSGHPGGAPVRYGPLWGDGIEMPIKKLSCSSVNVLLFLSYEGIHDMRTLGTVLVSCFLMFSQFVAASSETCEGVISILRISEYVDGGTEAGLREASALHNDWYVENGITGNSQTVIPIFDYDESTDSVVKNVGEVATLHFNSTVSRDAREKQGDEGWENFISVYNANTKITKTIFLCIPNGLLSNR